MKSAIRSPEKLHAGERSEKVRRSSAGSVLNSKVLWGCSVQPLPSVVEVLCGLSLNWMSVSGELWISEEERGADGFSRVPR